MNFSLVHAILEHVVDRANQKSPDLPGPKYSRLKNLTKSFFMKNLPKFDKLIKFSEFVVKWFPVKWIVSKLNKSNPKYK